MKVIDLLNKIANGEGVPKKFTYKDYFWEYDKRNEMWFTYFTRCGEMKNYRFDRLFYLNKCLNDEVEVIEDKKIRKIKVNYSPDIEEKIFYEDGDKPNHCILGDAGTELLINKINEIIDEINDLKEKK